MSAPDSNPFVFGGPHLDRLTLQRHDDTWLQSALSSTDTCFVPVCNGESVVLGEGEQATPFIVQSADSKPLLENAYCAVLLGQYQGRICFALGLNETSCLPGNITLSNLRMQFSSMQGDVLSLLGYARAMAHWHLHHRFCGKCGSPTRSEHAGHELHCVKCNNVIYPRINPAVIVLVSHAERCLLGNQRPSIPLRYSTLAGFVEPGEDLETALRREVYEETNIRVGTLQYQYSQPWPYPASLMLGFHAEALNTDIRLNDGELRDARWFTREELLSALETEQLAVSSRYSISYQLLRRWFAASESKFSADALDAAAAKHPV